MTEPVPIRVLLVDDHAVVRSGLGAFLLAFDDLDLVGEASSGEDAVRIGDGGRPNVLIRDLSCPAWTGRRRPAPSGSDAQLSRSLP